MMRETDGDEKERARDRAKECFCLNFPFLKKDVNPEVLLVS